MDKIEIVLPISIEMGVRKKKNVYLNLNVYRNMPFNQNNTLKKLFKKEVEDLVPNFYFEEFSIHYDIFLPNKLKRDIMNVGSIVDKFFCDTLVELERVPDDNYNYLKDVSFSFGGLSETKIGYVVATITRK